MGSGCLAIMTIHQNTRHADVFRVSELVSLGIANHQNRSAVIKALPKFLLLAPAIERYYNCAGIDNSDERNQPLGPVAHRNSDALPVGPAKLLLEGRGKTIGGIKELRETQLLLAVLYKQLVAKISAGAHERT